MKNGIVETEGEYEQWVRDMEDEWNRTEGACYPYYWIWGQKPADDSL